MTAFRQYYRGLFENDEYIIPRMSQLSQKTNQFNLTTKRYTEGDIKSFIENDNSKVIAFSVTDKFGDSGVTGLCIINFHDETQSVEIDTLLMSCRIIGRNIEYAFIDYIIKIIEDCRIIVRGDIECPGGKTFTVCQGCVTVFF